MLNGILSIVLFTCLISSNAGAAPPPIYPDGLHPVGPPVPPPFEGGALPPGLGNALHGGLPGVGINHPGGVGHPGQLPAPQFPSPWHIPITPAPFPQPIPATVEVRNLGIMPPFLATIPQVQVPDVFAPLHPAAPAPGVDPAQLWYLGGLVGLHQQKLGELRPIVKSINCARLLFNEKLKEPNLENNPNAADELEALRATLDRHNNELVAKRDEIYGIYETIRTPLTNAIVNNLRNEIGSTGANPVIVANAPILIQMAEIVQEHREFQEAKAAEAKRAQAVEEAAAQKVANEAARVADNVKVAQASEAQVNQIVHEANEILPHVTAQMEQGAANYIRDQLQNSETIAQNAVAAAQEGAPRDTIQLLGEYALDKATAVKDFLVGVHAGMNHAIISTGEAIKTIYNNPTLITNLSNNTMRLLTGRPDQIVNAARDALTIVGDALLDFELTMKYGSAADRGFIAGEFTGNLLIGLAGGEALGAAKLGMELVASDLVGTIASREVGINVARKIRTSPVLAPQMKNPETLLPRKGITLNSAKREVMDVVGGNVANLRSVITLLREYNIPLAGRREVIKAFTENSRVVTLAEDRIVYRYWTEGFNSPRGRWVTSELIENPHGDLALPNGGPYQTQEWTIPAGTKVIEGLASPNFGMPGGGGQIYVPNPGVLR